MRIMGRGSMRVVAMMFATVLVARAAEAGNNPNGIVFRAVGWFKGKAEITAGQIKCEIPTVSGAIGDGAFSVGLWNTYGSQTLFFPDTSNPFGNPCGGWLQLQNNLRDQALNVTSVELRFKILGAKRFRQSVVTSKGFPVACRDFKRETVYLGYRINPINSSQNTSSSGAPNVIFSQILPTVSPQLLSCLRGQYAGLPTDTYTSFPLRIRATAVAVSDAGDTYRSNVVPYTLSMRHTCGNGRVDDGEICDPSPQAPLTCFGFCNGGDPTAVPPAIGQCAQDASIGCTTDADCGGVCVAAGQPSECVCVY